MAANDIWLKVTITPLGRNTYRSFIPQSSYGSSEGPGNDFTIGPKLKAEIQSFVEQMPSGGFNRLQVQELGGKLFERVFGGKVLLKYNRCKDSAQDNHQRLHIQLAVLAHDLSDVPWEYFYDGRSFLLQSNQDIVRVINGLAPKANRLRTVKRLLLAIANPNDPLYTVFDANTHVRKLKQIFAAIKVKATVISRVTKERLEEELLHNSYDVLYFLGHGRFIPTEEGQLILEGRNRSADPLDAHNLASWLRDPPPDKQVQFVYLNSCSTAKTGRLNQFAGVAQRLLLDGGVASVVAMQTDMSQTAALNIAQGFFAELSRGKSPEQALTVARARANDRHSWGIPVIYSREFGPSNVADPAARISEGTSSRNALSNTTAAPAASVREIRQDWPLFLAPHALKRRTAPNVSESWPALQYPEALELILQSDADEIDRWHRYRRIKVEALIDKDRDYVRQSILAGVNETDIPSSYIVIPLVAVGAHEPEDFQIEVKDLGTGVGKDFTICRSSSNVARFKLLILMESERKGDTFEIQVTVRLPNLKMLVANDYDAIGFNRFARGVDKFEYIMRMAYFPVEPHCYSIQREGPPRELGDMEQRRDRGLWVLRKEVVDPVDLGSGFLFYYHHLERL